MRQVKVIRDFAAAGQVPAAAMQGAGAAADRAAAMATLTADEKAAVQSFRGVPYSIIINALLGKFGFEGGVVPEGVRNTTLYRLARQLRYICDFSAGRIMAVLPDWGLSKVEVQQTVLSAIGSQRAQKLPEELQSVLDGILKMDFSTQQKRQAYLEKLNPLPEKMPWLLQYIYKRYGRNGRSALVAALPMLGTLLGRLESKYLDGRAHRPVFMVVVSGRAGTGKGFIGDMQDWLLAPVLSDDAAGRDALSEYNRQKESKKGVKELSEKPNPCIRVLNATSSNGFLMERAQASLGQPLIVITEEIDESARANKNGAWADKSDIYRKAFDGALWGQDYMTYSGQVKLYCNLVFAGTYVSVRNYFSNVENGLMTRFFFTEMAPDCGLNVEVRSDRLTPADRKAASEVQRLYEMGSTVEVPAPDNVVSFQLVKARKDAYDFNEEKIAEWRASGEDEDSRDAAIDFLRRRAAVTLFRASQVCWALEKCRETQAGRAMAQWYANECYLNQYIMFADAINECNRENRLIQHKQDVAAGRVAKNDTLTRLLLELPDVFSRDDFKLLLTGKGMSGESTSKYLGRMIERDMIMATEEGFSKLKIEA